jgi:hypothetical protein
VVKSLESHSSSLETLSWRDGIHTEDQYYLGALGSLSGFVKLFHLEVPMAALAQQALVHRITAKSIVANLPSSVQFLTMNMIHDGRAYYKESLDFMAQSIRDYAPSLREVKVIYHSLLTEPSYDWKRFGKLLGDQGVLFEFLDSLEEQSEAESEGDWAPYVSRDSSDSPNSSIYEESLYSD